ncbi:MAG TPA: hypothetical protein PL041_13505 [Melioribacteraceae bacterium]|nr:hypothetical protein [Melioribacteraceae bacterium]
MENKQVYNFNNESFYLKDYGDITWQEDETIVNTLNGNNSDINTILKIVLKPCNTKLDINKFDFTKGELKVIKKLLKEEIVKRRNDFLAQ